MLLARADHYRGTIMEIYDWLLMLNESVPISTLYRWAEPKTSRRGSGQLKPAGYKRKDGSIMITRRDDGDKPVYRVSDARRQRLKKREGKQKA
jgi:hypothetical protein